MKPRVVKFITEYATLPVIVAIGLLLRLFLLAYGEWQDAHFAVKFTDIDYHVFSDAARHVTEGNSPFLRPTYRYTPLLALILAPNHLLFFAFGKTLFIICDLIAGWLIYKILHLERIKESSKLVSVSVWLLNPLTATVSARGNAESFLALLVLSSLFFLLRKHLTLSAIAYGTAVHMKIFPIVYSLPLFLFLNENYHKFSSSPTPAATVIPSHPPSLLARSRKFLNPHRVQFTVAAISVFFAWTGLFYALYGQEFIQEAYLYHITRRDIKHNFSVYFYLLYLIQGSWLSLPVGLLAFIPQALLLLMAAVWLHSDITFCCFVQTFVFVTFNKVCTSQYFLWYLSLLPLVIPFTRLSLLEGALIGILWFFGQAAWLLPAYLLEFHGYNTFMFIWLAGVLFFTINIHTLARIVKSHRFTHTVTLIASAKQE